jgi:hypothetical protein
VQHGQVLVLDSGDFRDVGHPGAVSGEQEDVGKEKDLNRP